MLSRRTFTLEQGKRTQEQIQQWNRYGIRTTARLDQTLLAQKDREINNKPIHREKN